MKLEDEDIRLWDYLDDELEPADRRDLEWSLLSDPALADRLAGLADGRRAVAGLPRPGAPCSLASSVLDRIETFERNGRRRPYLWFATAASLLFALILSLRTGMLAPNPAANQVAIQFPAANHDRPQPIVDVESTPPVEIALAVHHDEPERPGPIDPAEDDRGRIVSMLDRPGLGRILIVTPEYDPLARTDVDAIVRDTARMDADYGRISIAQGIVIDPQFPNEAEVFTAVVDDPEREQLFKRLAHKFPGIVFEGETVPPLGTLLAQVGRISVNPGRAAAGLGEPPSDRTIIALQDLHPSSAKGGHGDGFTVIHPDTDPSPPAHPGEDMTSHSLAIPSVGEGPRAGDERPVVKSPGPRMGKKIKGASKPAPVLVWVTSRQPPRPHD